MQLRNIHHSSGKVELASPLYQIHIRPLYLVGWKSNFSSTSIKSVARETTVKSNVSHYLRPFSKWGLLGNKFFPLRPTINCIEKAISTFGDWLECV